MVEGLLPLVWRDRSVAEGTHGGKMTDPAMPKARVDPSTSGFLMAAWVDVKEGYESAPLTTKERRAILMRFGHDMLGREIAAVEECSESTISARIETAVQKITARMNGAV
jgi:DNA-directed RNA polymerase specialized sigma24 family protein